MLRGGGEVRGPEVSDRAKLMLTKTSQIVSFCPAGYHYCGVQSARY